VNCSNCNAVANTLHENQLCTWCASSMSKHAYTLLATKAELRMLLIAIRTYERMTNNINDIGHLKSHIATTLADAVTQEDEESG